MTRRDPWRVVGLSLLLALGTVLALAPAVVRADPSARPVVRVPEGTVVMLRPATDVSGDGVKAGQEIVFVVDAPVVVDGVPVVAAGASALGTVIYASGSGVMHPHGALVVAVESVQAVEGSWLSLRAYAQATGAADCLLPSTVYQDRHSGFRGRNEHIVLPSSSTVPTFVARERCFARGPGEASPLRALPPAPPPAPAGMKAVLVEEASAISLSPARDITSATVQAGDRVEFRTTLPVTIEGRVAIPVGARALGTVILARGAARMGRAGELVICLDAVQAGDGSWIPVGTAGQRTKGKKHAGARAALTHFVPVVAILSKGQEAVVPATAVFQQEVREDSYVVVPAGR